MRVIAYRRVSTDEQASSGHGLGAQYEALASEAARRTWGPDVVEWVTDEGVSGSVPPEDRPALGPVLAAMRPGDVLLVAKLDRLGRSALDVLRLVAEAQAGGWHLVLLDLGLDTTTPVGRFVLTSMAGVAELERDLIRARTREALASARSRGVRLGRPVELDDDVRQRIYRERQAGETLTAIADRLNEEGVPTAQGGRWWPATVARTARSVELDREAEAARTDAEDAA